MPNKTLYIKSEEDMKIIDRAAKLLAFHKDLGLGTFLAEQCREIVNKYDKPGVRSSE